MSNESQDNWLCDRVESVIHEWETKGNDSRDENGVEMPCSPEYVFRKQGDWKGWNSFLSNVEGECCPDCYEENEVADVIEDIAWKQICHKYLP